MDATIVDLSKARSDREKPDPECIVKDEFGRPWYAFLVEYDDADGKQFGFQIFALDADDAQRRVDAIRASLRLKGQVFSTIPA